MSDAPGSTAPAGDAPHGATNDQPAQPDTGDGVDLAAELEKWKAEARKHEDRAKANAAARKELDQLKAQHMTEQERAVETARSEARAAALAEVGSKLVTAEFKAAAAGRIEQARLGVLLEGLNLAAFLDDAGDPDTKRIASFVEGIAPAAPAGGNQPPTFPQLAQGARGDDKQLGLGGDDPFTRALKSAVGLG